MDSLVKEFSLVLKNEDDILTDLLGKQQELRTILTDKNWDSLMNLMNNVNGLSESFQKFDSRRDEIQNQLSLEDIKPFVKNLTSLREKLLKCKIQNQVISNYVNTTKEFIASVIQDAVPHVGNKNYTNKGKITQPKAESVLVDLGV